MLPEPGSSHKGLKAPRPVASPPPLPPLHLAHHADELNQEVWPIGLVGEYTKAGDCFIKGFRTCTTL